MFCAKCGSKNDDLNRHCANCGSALQPSFATNPSPAGGDATGGLIPYKNPPALTAYYLGLFSLACGIFLGLPALLLGIKGLRLAAANPEVKGTVHAWIGIVFGGLTTLVSLIILGFIGWSYLQAK